MAFQKYDFQKTNTTKGTFAEYKNLAAIDRVGPMLVDGTGGDQPPADDSWKQSLEGVNSYYDSSKPTSSGSTSDYQNSVNHWQAYLDDLDRLHSEQGGTDGFDETKFNLYRDYANNSLKNAQDAYAAAVAQDKAAQSSKMQQANMKEQALKYAQGTMDAAGLGSQGVNGSLQAGIGNNYAQNVADIDNETSEVKSSTFKEYQQMANDNKGRLEENVYNAEQTAKNEKFEMASTMLNDAETAEDIQKIRDQYYEEMTDEQKKTFDYYADIAERNLATSNDAVKDSGVAATDYFSQADAMENKNGTDYLFTIGQGNYNQIKNTGYYVQGLGSGRKNDDIDITIGYNSRNKDHEYDLLCGGPADGSTSAILTKIVSGSTEGSVNNGTLLLYNDKLYIYTKKGWVNVEGDHDDVEDCIKELKEKGCR